METIIYFISIMCFIYLIRFLYKSFKRKNPVNVIKEAIKENNNPVNKNIKRYKQFNYKYIKGNRFGIKGFSPEQYGIKLLSSSGYSHKKTNK